MPSGNDSLKDLTFERATDLAALRCFKCGQEEVDHIIQDELPFTLTTNDLYLVKDGDEVVAMFCLQKDTHCLFLSDSAKEKMQKGSKPKPASACIEGEEFWERFNYDSKELTLLAVKENRRGQHLGAFIVESVIEKLANDPDEKREFLFVRALNTDKYTAVPFYQKCHFYAAVNPVPGQNLMMYRIIPKAVEQK